MPTLFVRCRVCRTEFPTRLAVGEEDRSTLVVSGLSQRCPSCGAEELYYTKDVFVPPAPEPGGAAPAGRSSAREVRTRGAREAGARFWSWLGIG